MAKATKRRRIANRLIRNTAATAIDEPTPVPELPATGLLRIAQVLQYIPISRTSWWLGVREGRYPQPQKLGSVPVWRTMDIRELINHGQRALAPAAAGASAD